MNLERALAMPGPLVAAWEAWTARPDRRLLVFSLQPKPARLALVAVPETERAAMSSDLRQRGIRVGIWVPHSEYFWCDDDQGFDLWSSSRLELEGKHGNLQLADGRRVSAASVASVASFVDEDMVHRGVRLELADGSSVLVAEERDPAALGDPTYNVDNFSIEAAWTDYLGAALASWLGKPHVNRLIDAEIAEERRIHEPSELEAMLTKYFIGPIGADVIARLGAEVARVLADPALHAGMARGFLPSNGRRGFGCAWREELAFQRTDPRVIDLAAWIAWAETGYPRARPYCPEAFAGTWIQREPASPSAPRWTLGRDGAFSAPGTPFASRITWCVHRHGTKLDDASIWLADATGVGFKRLLVLRVASTELVLEPTTPPVVRLERE
ncbi:MAG TPA: hypothetical protein VGH28_29935 [Polyangiaceae bacterium]|jgi:hypothetical protein